MSKKHSFCVGITHISRDPGSVLKFDLSGTLGDLRVVSSYVEARQIISVTGMAEAVHGGILISGKISAPWKGECRRCLGQAFGLMDIEFRELYERDDQDQAVEDGETYPYKGEMIDLSEMVKDQVLLELPLAPLCRSDCKGFCPDCGAELNVSDCNCAGPKVDPRWSALDVLVDKDN